MPIPAVHAVLRVLTPIKSNLETSDKFPVLICLTIECLFANILFVRIVWEIFTVECNERGGMSSDWTGEIGEMRRRNV